MKSILILFFFTFSYSLYSQNASEYNFSYSFEILAVDYIPIRYFPKKHVKEIHYEVIETKKKNNAEYIKYFNENGKTTGFKDLSDSANPYTLFSATYNEGLKPTKIVGYNKKGEIRNTTTYEWNSALKPTLFKTVDGKGKMLTLNTWEYSEDSDCLTESIAYKKGGQQANRIWKYSYYSPCQKSKSTLYKGNGKVVKEWTFDCKEEGEIIEKKEVKVCHWEESDGDYLIQVNENFDGKGRGLKTVRKYDGKDTSIVEIASYNENGNLLSKTTYDHNFERPLIWETYRKGEVYVKRASQYDNKNLISRAYIFKGKDFS